MPKHLQKELCKLHLLQNLNMKHFLSVLLFFIFLQGFSQNYFEVANFAYTTTPPNDFETSSAQTTVEEFALEFNFPVVLNKKSVLLTGLFANKTIVALDANMPKTDLNVLGLNLGINHTFNDRWSGTFMVFSRLASDKIKFSNDNLQIAFLSLFTNIKRDHLKWRYGIYANTEQYGIMLVPILGLYYVSNNNKFEANLNLPILADINYILGHKFWLGMGFDGLGTSYNLTNQNYSSDGAYVVKTSNELFGYLRFQINKSIFLNTKVGYAIDRKYEVYDANDDINLALTNIYFGDDRTRLNERFKDGVLFKIELLYRLYFE